MISVEKYIRGLNKRQQALCRAFQKNFEFLESIGQVTKKQAENELKIYALSLKANHIMEDDDGRSYIC